VRPRRCDVDPWPKWFPLPGLEPNWSGVDAFQPFSRRIEINAGALRISAVATLVLTIIKSAGDRRIEPWKPG
jgi:hypothetical protein